MPSPRVPAAPRPLAASDLTRERARAAGARRMLPWALLTALGGGAIAYVAGGGLRSAATLVAVGLVFTLFLWATSIPRCPSCGARLARARAGGEAAGEAETCARCGARFA